MSLESLFSGVNFASTMNNYCNANGWKIDSLNERKAVIKFGMSSGRKQTLYVIRYESTLEFSVPSMAIFDSENDIPHYLSTLLLKRNAERKIGFWCIEKIGSKHVYSVMQNVEMKLIDSNYFSRVVKALINECDDFEGSLQ
ncbi:hypothetical protein [Ectothiorhodospira magna]|uniref:hypothetical protein n=1 Tax=Ectothiorhodospira magna TaxID=867345 RepID=UPI000B7DA514|nr:hypothetical protein [Ectothiorhodospira magna]